MKTVWRFWPVGLLWLDMAYDFGLNMAAAIALSEHGRPAAGLQLAPDAAFTWLQAAAAGGMLLLMTWAWWQLWRWLRQIDQAQYRPLYPLRLGALVTVAAFSLPACWHGLWALWHGLHGQVWFDISNPRHALVALLLPYPLWLCLHGAGRQCRLRRRGAVAPATTTTLPNAARH